MADNRYKRAAKGFKRLGRNVRQAGAYARVNEKNIYRSIRAQVGKRAAPFVYGRVGLERVGRAVGTGARSAAVAAARGTRAAARGARGVSAPAGRAAGLAANALQRNPRLALGAALLGAGGYAAYRASKRRSSAPRLKAGGGGSTAG